MHLQLHIIQAKPKNHYIFMTNSHYTNLYSILEKFLLSNINIHRQEIQTMIFKEPLQFSVIQCSNLKFITDLHHTIQLILYDNSNNGQNYVQLQINPFNKFSNNFYKKLDQKKFNFWEAYNCRHQSLLISENIEQSSPYTPLFYFGHSFKEFKTMKASDNDVTLPPRLNNKTIKIRQWKIKIVNISESGWYAPIIAAIAWKFEKLINRENLKNVSLILYQPKVKQIMQQMWRKDLKKIFVVKTQPYSCFYPKMRASQKTINVSKVNLFSQDFNQQKIKYNKDKGYHYVPIGNHEQLNLILNYELHKNYQVQKRKVKVKHIQKQEKSLLKKSTINEAQKRVQEKQRKIGYLWSSDQEQQHLDQECIQYQEDQLQEQSQQQPEFLRYTYLKYLKSQKSKIK